uniref:Uncharacterized protein n=1 Tax=viral metagenome TaxID=1070528 RepID=A0A6C0JQW6_9ZZZZ
MTEVVMYFAGFLMMDTVLSVGFALLNKRKSFMTVHFHLEDVVTHVAEGARWYSIFILPYYLYPCAMFSFLALFGTAIVCGTDWFFCKENCAHKNIVFLAMTICFSFFHGSTFVGMIDRFGFLGLLLALFCVCLHNTVVHDAAFTLAEWNAVKQISKGLDTPLQRAAIPDANVASTTSYTDESDSDDSEEAHLNETTLLRVDWVQRNRYCNPIAVITPISVNGNTIKKVCIPMNMIKDLRIGSRISIVFHAGVIPAIDSIIEKGDGAEIDIPYEEKIWVDKDDVFYSYVNLSNLTKEDLNNMSEHMLESICDRLGIPRSTKTEMVNKLSAHSDTIRVHLPSEEDDEESTLSQSAPPHCCQGV